MKNNTKISLVLIGTIMLQGFGGLAYADVVIDGVTYDNAWIESHPAEVAKYIDANPGAAAAILQANPGAAAAVANAYNAAKGTNYTADTGMTTLNQEAAKSTAPTNIVVVGNQAYTNEWIKNNQAAVVDYISKNPGTSATILQNASADTKQAVLNAYNKATGNNMTLADGNQWINQNATVGLTKEWLAKHGGISKDPVWNDYTGLANDAQVAMWLKENPGLTPAQIVDAMQKYGIGLNQLTRAMRANNPSSTVGAQDLMKMANDAGISNEQLSQKGIIGPMNWADTRNNIWWAIQAGIMNQGVMCAAFLIDQGTINPECTKYTQADMNMALSYQKNGYWGPKGSGDPYTELTKAGMIKNGSYTGPQNWGNGTTKQSVGPSVAGTNVAGAGAGGSLTTAGYYGQYATTNALSNSNYPTIFTKIQNDNLTVGTRVGDTLTYTNQQIKDFFASNPSLEQVASMAASQKMTTYNIAQALTIGKGAPYDPAAVVNYVKNLSGYALGPDNILVRLTPGQTKDANGLLQGSWSSDPGHVSYTDWARQWYAAGNGDVNGGRVNYGQGGGAGSTVTFNTTGGAVTTTTTSTNPYVGSFSQTNLSTLDTWITSKIRAKESTMSAANYTTFINALIAKITSMKSSMTDQTKIMVLNYILHEVTAIQTKLSGSGATSTSFLDDLLR